MLIEFDTHDCKGLLEENEIIHRPIEAKPLGLLSLF